MSIKKLVKTETPARHLGFMGPDHTARAVVQGKFRDTDPFIVLMDDELDKKDNTPVGGAHPHAGFETVSLLLEGEMGDTAHTMKGGDFQIMTAGSGVVHTETIDKIAKMRLLQLWLNLPMKDRWASPRVQDLPLEHVPASSRQGVHIRLYSGAFAGLKSPVQNYVPLIVAEISMEVGSSTIQHLPTNYNAFLYVLKGSVGVGEENKRLEEGQVGWLNVSDGEAESDLHLKAGVEGARFVLYAGKPTGDDIVSYGPFIGDSPEDIKRLYHEYNRGGLKHISSIPAEQRIKL